MQLVPYMQFAVKTIGTWFREKKPFERFVELKFD
jgi:hypothetical protein